MFGGVQAVTWTDVKQMFLIVVRPAGGACVALIARPARHRQRRRGAAHRRAPPAGCRRSISRLDLTDRYTFWSGTIGALFLFLSYFGTDQSQVQRYLTAKSVDEARTSLLMSAYWKIPLQALVLLIGVLMFVFYLFTPPPMLFNPVHDERGARERAGRRVRRARAAVQRGDRRAGAQAARAAGRRASAARRRRRAIAVDRPRSRADEQRSRSVRARGRRARQATCRATATYNDVNYVFPTFIVTQLPVGLVGLLMAAIFAAAMSTISGELAALSTATVIDFYRRWVRDDGDETHFLRVSQVGDRCSGGCSRRSSRSGRRSSAR